jgi:phage-related protein
MQTCIIFGTMGIMEDKRIPARFYCTEAGNEPVRDWLLGLSREERKAIGVDIKTVEFGWPIGMPTCRPMGNGLFEVRSSLPSEKIARVLFCIHDSQMVLLHAFIKKSQKTPKTELDLALSRKRMLEGNK